MNVLRGSVLELSREKSEKIGHIRHDIRKNHLEAFCICLVLYYPTFRMDTNVVNIFPNNSLKRGRVTVLAIDLLPKGRLIKTLP